MPSTPTPNPTCTTAAITQLIHDPTILKLVQDGNSIVLILVCCLLIHGLTSFVKALR